MAGNGREDSRVLCADGNRVGDFVGIVRKRHDMASHTMTKMHHTTRGKALTDESDHSSQILGHYV